ncbi:MFS transporter [Rhodocytophaga rosea]|uniref:MFS transporter n=1 Tax=Rhodocytophaga rosea TaxID=2704465 RepID=A0A6C0GEY1_9BACT|nr:MFS transporter [Rhodocytophaga rosea]QHT66526.1 MFS transporter [Rhodocytophaga rosea]
MNSKPLTLTSGPLVEKNNPKVLNAWCLYDWANSVYTLTIATAVFPIYFTAVTTKPDGSDQIPFLWMTKSSSVVYTYSLSIAFLLVAFISPLLSGIADYSGNKKLFMKFFVYMGSIACITLYFFDSQHISLGIVCFIVASIGYAGSLVFYNAFLPQIATPDRFDSLSAKGYSLGYIGSVLLLIMNLVIIQKPDWFGLQAGTLPARISFVMVGVWWLGFSAYSLYYLPDSVHEKKTDTNYLLKGFYELKSVMAEVKQDAILKTFLLGFFFYSMGFQCIMYLAGIFGAKELKLPEGNLIAVLLIIQLVGIGGAMLFVYIAKKAGNLQTLSTGVLVCMLICVAAYFIYTALQFYILAVIVGMVMGGIQSMSRSTYSRLLPETKDHASYFSFYEFTEKTGIVLGTATYAFIEDSTGSRRMPLFALIVFFMIGLFFLIRLIVYRPIPAKTT